jgi:DNA polymerase III sliding clamp (beta) subunit (PCNA family)
VDCLDRANVLAGEGAHYVIIAEPDGNTLRLRSNNQSGGEAEEELAADIHPEFKRFGFNPRYAAQFLSTLAVDELTVEQTDPNGPCLFHSPNAPDFTGVLMPVRV